MHFGTRDDLFVTLAIGGESHTAVKEHLEVGPNFVYVALARDFEHTVKHRKHPRRHTAYVAYVLVNGFAGYEVALGHEV